MDKVQAIPPGMHTLTPHLVCHSAVDAILFYVKAFGATELARLPGPDGRLMHAMVKIGDSPMMLVDEYPEHERLGPLSLKGSPVTVHLYVDDVDATIARAVAAGARITMPVAEMFWGDRYCRLQDPFGHHWSVATHVRDVSVEEIRESTRKIGEGAQGSAK